MIVRAHLAGLLRLCMKEVALEDLFCALLFSKKFTILMALMAATT